MGWAYRKAIVINATADGTQTNYPMKVTLIKGVGVDVLGTIYLNNHALKWPIDIFFTTSNGITEAKCWREVSTATSGTWWIKANSIPLGGTWTGYIYYGNADAADASNGDTTFDFFDDFPGVALDTVTKWTVTQGNTPTVANSICTLKGLSNVRSDIVTKTIWGTNYAIRSLLKSKHFNDTNFYEAYGWSPANQSATDEADYANLSASSNAKYVASGGTYKTILGWVADTYAVQDIIRNGATNIVCKVNDANTVTLTDGLNNTVSMGAYAYVYSANNSELDLDWVLVRACTLNEPTWGNTGAEQGLQAALSFKGTSARFAIPTIAQVIKSAR